VADRARRNECCPQEEASSCCSLDAILSVDERGQMVLPKEVRQKAGIRPGDKLGVITMQRDGKACCITLVKVEELSGLVREFLGPVMSQLLEE